MITVTIADVIGNTLPVSGWEGYHLYVIRDGDFVLYVGKSDQNIIDRLQDHLGLTYRGESQVGELVNDNTPESLQWKIDLRNIPECASIVKRHYPACKKVDLYIAEHALILEFAPPLNVQSNPYPNELPRKYTRRRDARLLDAYRRIHGNKS